MYYDKLLSCSSEDEGGGLDLCLIVAPQRTGSTLTEAVFSRSPHINFHIHEPFVRHGYYGESADQAYRQIYELTGQNSRQQTRVVIKEMAHWIGAYNEFERLFLLTKKPILFLIRNPLLTMESRLRTSLKTFSIRDRLSFQLKLLDYFAQERNFSTSKEARLPQKAPLPQLVSDLETTTHLPTQLFLMDHFAHSKGWDSWEKMVQAAIKRKEYKDFEGVLPIGSYIFLEESGWTSLIQQILFLKKLGRPYLIVDTTEMRLDPEGIFSRICEEWQIPFTRNMLESSTDFRNFETGQNKPHHAYWYQSLTESSSVKPPTETPPPLEAFPNTLAHQLSSADLPFYIHLFKEPNKVTSKRDILSIKFEMPGAQTEHFATIKSVDPLFSALYHPELLNDETYLHESERYSSAFAILRTYMDRSEIDSWGRKK